MFYTYTNALPFFHPLMSFEKSVLIARFHLKSNPRLKFYLLAFEPNLLDLVQWFRLGVDDKSVNESGIIILYI
jgi:hypothetical protein